MRILSGIQPTRHSPHRQLLRHDAAGDRRCNAEGEAFYFIADYHALTTVRDPASAARKQPPRRARLSRLRTRSGNAACFFRQSDVPAGHGACLDL